MINLQRSFEQSLRSSSPYPPLLQPNRDHQQLKISEVHKGCFGKAHACGTARLATTTPTRRINVLPPARKNSASSETVSDTSSDLSSQNQSDSTGGSWRSRRTVSPVKGNRERNKTPVPRQRLLSDGDREGSEGEKKTEVKPGNSLQYSRSLRSNSTSSNGASKPPWQHVYSLKLDHHHQLNGSGPKVTLSRTSSLNNRNIRNSFRRKTVFNYDDLHELAQRQKPLGGQYKHLDGVLMVVADRRDPDKEVNIGGEVACQLY